MGFALPTGWRKLPTNKVEELWKQADAADEWELVDEIDEELEKREMYEDEVATGVYDDLTLPSHLR